MRYYKIEVFDNEGNITISAYNDGFNVLELIGLLESKKQDLLNQLKNQSEFERTFKKDGTEYEIKEKE